MDDPVSNKTFEGKITITASYITEIPTDYDLCVEKYGEDSVNCSIIAGLDTTGKCPTVKEDGTVKVSSSESTNGYLCSAPDDYGTSYYYRGNVENNWVKFAGYYWQILRINGDNSIRMIYAGDASVIDALDNKEEVLKNGYNDSTTKYTQIGESPYNQYWKKDNVQESVNSRVSYDNAGVGYMYGNRDRIVEGSTEYYSTHSQDADETIYYAKEYTYDAAKDRFTVNDETIGNRDLTYPIGLLTTDEAVLAGGFSTSNFDYYLYTGNDYWTMSPYHFNGYYASVLLVLSNGNPFGSSGVFNSNGVRPVINLKPNSLKLGDGTATNPYRIE